MICDICIQSAAGESIMREWTIQLVVLFNSLYIQIHVMMLRGMQIPWSSFLKIEHFCTVFLAYPMSETINFRQGKSSNSINKV
mgnify:CR=1 FL=1